MTLSLDLDALRDYDSSGAEMRFPNVRRGKCPVGQRCSECMMSHIPELVLHVPGDLYVIGIPNIISARPQIKVRNRNLY